MTKQEYGQARDDFARVVRSIDNLTDWFEPPNGVGEGEDWEDALDRYEFYMTGAEFREVQRAKEIFEKLAGRNASRAL